MLSTSAESTLASRRGHGLPRFLRAVLTRLATNFRNQVWSCRRPLSGTRRIGPLAMHVDRLSFGTEVRSAAAMLQGLASAAPAEFGRCRLACRVASGPMRSSPMGYQSVDRPRAQSEPFARDWIGFVAGSRKWSRNGGVDQPRVIEALEV